MEKSSVQIPDEDLDETFKDCRIEDVPTEYSDEDEADVPQAKGKSFEDIDLAVRTVKKPKASKAEMVQAGEVFKDLDGTELFARMINDEKLFMQIEESINIAVQAMNEKDTMKNSRKTNVKSNTSDIEAKEKKEQQEQEKILAAKMAGIKEVLVPAENKKDIEEIPEEIRDGIQISYVKNMKEVLKKSLLENSYGN